MWRLWLPQRHLLLQRLHVNEFSLSWDSRGATSMVFLHHICTSGFCLDRRSRVTVGSYESSISILEKKSKGQKKREALRSVDWAAEFANFSDSQVRRAIRWGNLNEEVYDAVRIVKKIGKYGRHARTRQLKLIGSMLRQADPELMEAIIKAIKDGDVEGVFIKSGNPEAIKDGDVEGVFIKSGNPEDENEGDKNDDDDNAEDDDYDDLNAYEDEDDEPDSFSSEGELETMEHSSDTIERWMEGLLSGDSDVTAEVYSIKSAEFNRQELRRLVRNTLKSENKSSESTSENNPRAVPEKPTTAVKVLDPRAKLREYLEFLVVKKSKV